MTLDGKQVDSLDRRLVALLVYDVRRSSVSLACELGVSNVTIDNRIQKLRRSGVITFKLSIDYRKAGAALSTLCCLKAAPERAGTIIHDLLKYPGVSRVTRTAGLYNIVAAVYFNTSDEAALFLTGFLDRTAGIESCQVLTVVQTGSMRAHRQASSPFDAVDDTLVGLLQDDSRQSAAQLARRTRIPARTVRRRLDRLIESGFVIPTLVTIPSVGGLTEGDLFLRIGCARLTETWDRLIARPSLVTEAALTLGAFDIVAHVRGDSRAAIQDFIDHKIKALEGLEDCLLLIRESTTFGRWSRNSQKAP